MTRRLKDFAGSELVAFEVAEWFASQGDEVTLAANEYSAPMSSLPHPFAITTDLASLKLYEFDLVWTQHHMVLHVPNGIEAGVRALNFPLVVQAALSPFVPIEHIDGRMARALRGEVWANSRETAQHIAASSRGMVSLRKVRVFHNAAPSQFLQAPPPPTTLGRILAVSNHFPVEMEEAIQELRSRGIVVDVIGAGHHVARVGPQELARADAVISIGKTVVDAILMNRPAFVYDSFGGPGWLTVENVRHHQDFNFSGRPNGVALTSHEITERILGGFAEASFAVSEIRSIAPGLELEEHLGPLRQRVRPRRRAVRAIAVGLRFLPRSSRAHLATLRALTAALG